jgi:hypothetical protein
MRIIIGIYSLIWSTVYGQVSLPISGKVKRFKTDRPSNRFFENTSGDGVPTPLNRTG